MITALLVFLGGVVFVVLLWAIAVATETWP